MAHTFIPALRFDSLDTLRHLNSQFKEACDKVESRHPNYFLIKTIREANCLAATLSSKKDQKNYKTARKIQEEDTPTLRLYEMERYVVKLLGGKAAFGKLPHAVLDFNLLTDPMPEELLIHRVMSCEDRHGRFFISLRIMIDIISRGQIRTVEAHYYLSRGNRWSIKYCCGNSGYLCELGRALVCLFDQSAFGVNPIAYTFCRGFIRRVVKGKHLNYLELEESKIPRASDLRTISLVAKKRNST